MIGKPIAVFNDIIQNGYHLARCCTSVLLASKSATKHLHITNGTKNRARYYNHVCFWGVETGRQNTIVAQHFYCTLLKLPNKVLPRGCISTAMYRRGPNTLQLEKRG